MSEAVTAAPGDTTNIFGFRVIARSSAAPLLASATGLFFPEARAASCSVIRTTTESFSGRVNTFCADSCGGITRAASASQRVGSSLFMNDHREARQPEWVRTTSGLHIGPRNTKISLTTRPPKFLEVINPCERGGDFSGLCGCYPETMAEPLWRILSGVQPMTGLAAV